MTAASVPTCAANRFPVTVIAPDGQVLDRVRLVLTVPEPGRPGRLMVWTQPGSPARDVPFEPGDSQLGARNSEWRVATGDGVYLVRPRRGCRCGPLGRYEPFDPMVMGSLP